MNVYRSICIQTVTRIGNPSKAAEVEPILTMEPLFQSIDEILYIVDGLFRNFRTIGALDMYLDDGTKETKIPKQLQPTGLIFFFSTCF